MQLTRVRISGLFGELDHDIAVHPDGLSFIFGLNGSGKTTSLQLLSDLFSSRLSALARSPFSRVEVWFDHGVSLFVERQDVETVVRGVKKKLIFTMHGQEPWTFAGGRGQRAENPGWVSRRFPHLVRVGPRAWVDRDSAERLSYVDILERFENDLPADVYPQTPQPDWLARTLAGVPAFFIPANRLMSNPDMGITADPDDGPQHAIETFAADMARQLQETLASYANYSQELERSFPSRFLDPSRVEAEPIRRESIEERYERQAKIRAKYVRSGLLEPGNDIDLPDSFDADKLQFLSAYLTDIDDKLARLSGFAAKLEIFLDIVNSKLRRKKVILDRQSGMRVENTHGSNIPLTALSSGEQQEVILNYRLLFSENAGTLVLIDEPELSLHVDWQFQLIPDLIRIAEVAKLTFLIATHSPQVVNGRDDITTFLREPE